MTNKTVEQILSKPSDWYNISDWITFDNYTFNNLSEVFEYIQGRLDVIYKSNESDAEKEFQSMAIMKRFNDAVYSHYEESI